MSTRLDPQVRLALFTVDADGGACLADFRARGVTLDTVHQMLRRGILAKGIGDSYHLTDRGLAMMPRLYGR